MRYSIRALGWAITISMLLLLLFLTTAVHFVFQTILVEQGIRLGRFEVSVSENSLVLALPIAVNNTGYYDMSDFTVATELRDVTGKTLTANSTFIGEVKRGSLVSTRHTLCLSIAGILSNMTQLLFNDSEFKIDFSIGFKYAYALGFELTMANMSMPWGAPLHGLSLRSVSPPRFNGTHLSMDVALELENHSFLEVAGYLQLKIYNREGGYVGSGRGLVHVPPSSSLAEPINIIIEVVNLRNYTGRGYVEVYLELPVVEHTFELGKMNYG